MAASVIGAICILGAALLMFPTVAAWFSQYEQSQRIDDYRADVSDLGVETLHDFVRQARDYNRSLTGGGADIAAGERLPIADQPEQSGDYAALLRADADGLMARLKIPAITVDLPIYHGTDAAVLEHGVGHLEGTALPVGGSSTHSVLTAHRGLATAELFTHLDLVEVDDTFTIEVFGEVNTYRVIETQVVDPSDTQSLQPRSGEDLVTLVTCTPLGVNSHRILVTGERVVPTPAEDLADAGRKPEIPFFPWWILVASAVVIGVGLYIWLSGRPVRPTAHSATEPAPEATSTALAPSEPVGPRRAGRRGGSPPPAGDPG